MRFVLTLIATIALVTAQISCGGVEDGPNPAPVNPTPDNPKPDDPTPDNPTPDNPTPTPDNPTPDGGPPSPPPPPPPDPNAKCAPAKQYIGTAQGTVDATIPLLGKINDPVQCDVKYAIQDSGGVLKATGTIQVIDPLTQKPWAYAPQPFTFEADVNCDQMTGPLKGNISALGFKIPFAGTVQGTWDGTTFKGPWSGAANGGITAKASGTWQTKP